MIELESESDGGQAQLGEPVSQEDELDWTGLAEAEVVGSIPQEQPTFNQPRYRILA